MNTPKAFVLIEQCYDGGCCYSHRNVCVYSDRNSHKAIEDQDLLHEIISSREEFKAVSYLDGDYEEQISSQIKSLLPERLYSTIPTLVYPHDVDFIIEEIPIHED